ncbi:cytokine receptor common subunit beta-like [Chelonoidis abingdonii]|uniref:cytokine receptor common subunit beta-like n=1 Tax=Chelonoidis abingdonii TaxID=106734 RepID=UPI0013F1A195|nr:cytokine receptor common subunit beta-like [Chelonoidis abingdonii]
MKAFCMALLALCWAFRVGESRESLPMQSLRCYNDFTSQTTCTWQECTAARRFLNMTLHHEDIRGDSSSPSFFAHGRSTQIPCEPLEAKELPICQDFCVCWSCHRNSTLFAIGAHDNYSFKPDRLLQAELNVNLSQNVKLFAPVSVTMTKTKDQEYELRWTKQILSYDYIGQRYEFLYWKTGDSLENAQLVNISNDKPPFIFTLQMLEPSTHYRGKMRARVNTLPYQGHWSEWSEECTWETESVWSPLILPLLVPVFTIMLIAFGWCSYRGLLSKKKKWEERIPNPGRSQLLQSYLQKVPLGSPLPSSQLDFGKQSPSEKTDLVSFIQVLDGPMKVSSAELPAAVADRMMCFLGALDPENPYKTLEMTTPAPRPAALAGCHSSQGTSQSLSPATLPWRSSAKVTASQAPMSCFDFNGPMMAPGHRGHLQPCIGP